MVAALWRELRPSPFGALRVLAFERFSRNNFDKDDFLTGVEMVAPSIIESFLYPHYDVLERIAHPRIIKAVEAVQEELKVENMSYKVTMDKDHVRARLADVTMGEENGVSMIKLHVHIMLREKLEWLKDDEVVLSTEWDRLALPVNGYDAYPPFDPPEKLAEHMALQGIRPNRSNVSFAVAYAFGLMTAFSACSSVRIADTIDWTQFSYNAFNNVARRFHTAWGNWNLGTSLLAFERPLHSPDVEWRVGEIGSSKSFPLHLVLGLMDDVKRRKP